MNLPTITEIECGPKKEWVQFFSGDEPFKVGEGTVKAVDRVAFRKLLEDRLADTTAESP